MQDTLRTVAVGLSGNIVAGIGILPDIMSVAVGLATLIYIIFKINKEVYYAKERKKGDS